VLLLALSAMWGLSFLFIEFALAGLTPLWIVTARTLTGGIVLLVILRLRRRRLPRGWTVWRHLLVLGSVNNALPWAGVAWAQQELPSGLTALLMALVPTSTLLVAAAIGLERLTRVRVVGLLLALGGVGLIVAGDLDQPGRVLAVVTVVAATVLYAIGAVYAKRHVSGTLPPLALATGQVIAAATVTTPIALAVDGLPGSEALEASVLGAVLALGVFGTGLAFLVFYVLIERVGATNATMTTYLIPLVAVVAGAVVLDERLGFSALAGGALIGIGIWLSQRSSSRTAVDLVEENHP
jgi:drug/metabolite transporter (DMT)-like permease